MRPLKIIAISILLAVVAQADSLSQFAKRLEPLASRKRIEADFTQTRRFNAIGFEMKSSGRLVVETGKQIIWETLNPTKSRCTMTGTSCQVWDELSGKTTSLPASKYPWVSMVFSLNNAWTTGNLTDLQKEFDIRVLDERTLLLEPRSSGIASLFASIKVTFAADYREVLEVCFTEKGGDTISIAFKGK